MARYKKKKGHRSQKMTVPVAVAIPIGMMAYDLGTKAMNKDMAGMNQYIFLDRAGGFNLMSGVGAYAGLVGGMIAHKGASYLGVNRALARAKIPFVRI